MIFLGCYQPMVRVEIPGEVGYIACIAVQCIGTFTTMDDARHQMREHWKRKHPGYHYLIEHCNHTFGGSLMVLEAPTLEEGLQRLPFEQREAVDTWLQDAEDLRLLPTMEGNDASLRPTQPADGFHTSPGRRADAAVAQAEPADDTQRETAVEGGTAASATADLSQ